MKRRKVSFKNLIKKFICKVKKDKKVKVDFQKVLFFLYRNIDKTLIDVSNENYYNVLLNIFDWFETGGYNND